MDRYQVRFTTELGETRYGIVDRWSAEARELARENRLLIADAITPATHVVEEADVTDIDLDPSHRGENEYHRYVETEFRKAQSISDALPEGMHAGSLFCLPAGDGRAWYLVTKVNKRTCRIEWRGFSPDRWTDAVLGWGGLCPR